MFRWTRLTPLTARPLCRGLWLLVGLSGISAALAQPAPAQGIYTCTDARGRKLTSDRPISECIDREQQVLNPSGTLKARIGPTLTAQERSELELKNKAAQEAQARINEEKRRDRALLVRYPNKTLHDKERVEALNQVEVVRQAALRRVEELLRQRGTLDQEMEFYKKDPSKAPASLRRLVDEVNQSLAVQGRFIADQDGELKRINARFEEELGRLQQLWALQSAPAAISRGR
jgi:PAS domain-containing protein